MFRLKHVHCAGCAPDVFYVCFVRRRVPLHLAGADSAVCGEVNEAGGLAFPARRFCCGLLQRGLPACLPDLGWHCSALTRASWLCRGAGNKVSAEIRDVFERGSALNRKTYSSRAVDRGRFLSAGVTGAGQQPRTDRRAAMHSGHCVVVSLGERTRVRRVQLPSLSLLFEQSWCLTNNEQLRLGLARYFLMSRRASLCATQCYNEKYKKNQ